MKIKVTDSQDIYPMPEPKDFAPPGGPEVRQLAVESLALVGGGKGDGRGSKTAEEPKGNVWQLSAYYMF